MIAAILTTCTLSIFGPVSDCIPPRPSIRELPLLVTWYNPAMGGLNCDGDCSHLSLAPMHPAFYGRAAACPAEFVGLDFTAVVSHPAIGERACLDRGGAVVVEYRYVPGVGWLWLAVVDLLEHGPHPTNWQLLYGWRMEWRETAGVIEGLMQ